MALSVVSGRQIRPEEVILGCTCISPDADGKHPDPGQANANALLRAAAEAGIVEADTAPWYSYGVSEERLGRAIREEGLEGRIRVYTKTGRLFSEPDGTPSGPGFDEPGRAPLSKRVCTNDYTATGTDVSLSQSLARMGLPGVFGLRIHDPNDNSNNVIGAPDFVDEVAIALDCESGMCAGLRGLREKGVIAHVGLGMNCNREAHQGVPDEVLRLLRGCKQGTFDSALLAGGWNLLTQAGMPCFAECERLGVDVFVAGVFASGMLVADGGTYAYKAAPSLLLEKKEQWRKLAAKHECSLPAVAIAFAMIPACVKRLVLGMVTPEQVKQNMAWVEESGRVPAAIWADAKNIGLLGPDVPTPMP